ncbi:MAG TPA: S8 family serine peptidase [Thermoanaerobaculia bacterium]
MQYAEHRFEAAAATRVIVELDASAASRREDLVARLRADLRPSHVAAQHEGSAAPRIAHEYRTVFLGAAIEADDATVARIRALPYVRAVHPDRVMRASAAPAVSPASIVDARTKVNASSLGTGGAGIVVAVIDTGIDYMHPALGGGLGAGFKVAGGYDFVNGDADPMDDNGHGTHVAGTIAASAPDLIGVAPEATLIAYKVLNAGGTGSSSDIIAAIERAVDPNGDGDPSDHVHVANLSLGGAGDAEDPGSRAVDAAVAAGVVMVVAAGNDGTTASIGSPGTALDALTVAAIDDDGRVTDFSSRGPSPRLLGFKPDVAAPGFQVVSARLGGGTVALNGTSMAAPHVAGVAALLRKLHPTWTPAEVKAAITSSATPVNAAPFARGAGRADARAAHESRLFVNSSGMSFGIRPSRTGTTTETRSFRLTNRTTGTQSLAVAPGTVPAGVTVRVTPTSVQLPAGASADVTVELETANASFEYPNDWLVGGDIRITGSATASVPWAVLRSARARVTYDGFAMAIYALGPGGAQGPRLRDPHRTEIFLTPGKGFDFLVRGFEPGTGEQRLIVRPGVDIDGDHLLEIRKSEATLEVTVDGREETGRPLAERSMQDDRIEHSVGSRMFWASGNDRFSLLVVEKKADARRLLYSPLPDTYQLYHFEQLIDFAAGETYTIEHDALRGLAEPKTLASGGDELLATTVRWRGAPAAATACAYDALTDRISLSFSSCFSGPAPAARAFVHRINNERFPLAHNGMMFQVGGAESQALRGRDGRTVLSSDPTPGVTAERIEHGGSVTLGAGPAHPFALPGTRTAGWFRWPLPGIYDASRATLATQMEWWTFDAAGNLTGTGTWLGTAGGQAPPEPQAQSRLVARHRGGTLEVQFAATLADRTAPTVTSLRVADAEGKTTDRLAAGQAATLRFSVADVDYTRAAETQPSRPEATKAWFRTAGTETWQPLAVSVTGSESGHMNTLGHFPAGDLYSAALDAATATGDRWLDLRLEFSDPAGNVVRWTQEKAVSVGNPTEPGRRRSARK